MKEGPVVTDVPRPVCVERGDSAYPASLTHFFGESAPRQIFLLGSATLLRPDLLALFCSIKCPGDVILKTFDLIRAIREADIPVIGGFHTPMERDCLDILLRGTQPVVICPARSLERIRLSTSIREGLLSGRVLLVSAFGPGCRRATAELADQRNRLVAALASWAFVSHAAPGGKTEALCCEMVALGKPLFTVESPANANLLAMKSKPLAVGELSASWERGGNHARMKEILYGFRTHTTVEITRK